MINNLKIIFGLSLFVLLFGCDPNRVLDHNSPIDKIGWYRLKPITEVVTINDTKQKHNFYINIRNNNEYPYSNIYMFINTKVPSGKSSRDTVECVLADVDGKWLGKSSGDISDHRILIKQNVLFPDSGTYTFEIEHAMRVENLLGITDVGLRIEKAK